MSHRLLDRQVAQARRADGEIADGEMVGFRMDITELRQREESFRLLFEANPVAMIVFDEKDLTLLEVNEAAVALYGYPRERFVGMNLLDLIPADRKEFVRKHSKIADGKVLDQETPRHLTADGSTIHVDIYVRTFVRDGRPARLVAIVDVTERRKAEETSRRAEHFLETLIEHVPIAVVVKDAATLRYRYINAAAEEYFGVPRDRMIGKLVFDIHPAADATLMDTHDREVLEARQTLNLPPRPLATWKGTRSITSRRVPILGPANRSEYLLTLIDDVTEREASERQIAFLARHDALTGLPNRAAFAEHLGAACGEASRSFGQFALLSIDIDRFKETNDVFGHAVGDTAMKEIGRRFAEVAGGSFVARLGGDEFAVVARVESGETAGFLANRFLECCSREIDVEGNHLQIGVSIGVALYPTDGTNPSVLLANADAALHRAKTEGRGTIRYFTADIDQRLRQRRGLYHELRRALDRGELVLHYQPQTTMAGEVTGFEALVRWNHPERGLVPPSEFIPVAEESGLIGALGEWTLRTASFQAAGWPRDLTIAVNLSPAQLGDTDLPMLICGVLLESGLRPDRLELEITESVLIDDYEQSLSILRRIKALGVRIAMDDFGTGYSSLSYLHAFPFDKIKIDRSFIANLEDRREAAAIARTIINLGRGLNLPVLAEGVETEGQIAFLSAEGCNAMQGFALGRPAPIESYAEFTCGRAGPHSRHAVRHLKQA